jgi:hypothetical protein
LIVFDELKYIEDIIKNGYKNKKYTTFDNIILVKYWKYKGFDQESIKNKLKKFIIEHNELYNTNIIDKKVQKAIEIGQKHELLTDVQIEITDNEIEAINRLKTIELRKMMFVLLVIWKFKGRPKRFNVSNIDLMRLSEVRTYSNAFWNLIYQLTQSGLLSMVEYKNKSYYKLHIDVGGAPLFQIRKFDNLIYYYLRLIKPEKYKECECGVPIKITSNNQKYCKVCWKEREKELWRESKKQLRCPSLENG